MIGPEDRLARLENPKRGKAAVILKMPGAPNWNQVTDTCICGRCYNHLADVQIQYDIVFGAFYIQCILIL